ncbi:MAG: UvrD-helicase domain-containing protein [Bacteroidales bacterium]|jgi:DNA helicase-2/ATP-dependent DNA helicase PcrA|nr:UvrD-helicase domain-containing protein [Bacteroidales bacterium]
MTLENLNEKQQEAVKYTDGAALIIAGAGSGKTLTLTYRIAYLIESGVNPFNILALTFTNKAAQEMKERIVNLVGNRAKDIWMGTFHSVFAKILRIEADHLGYVSNFTIYDTEDAKNLIKNIVKDMNLDDKVYNKSFVYGRISSAKNNLYSPQDYLDSVEISSSDRANGKPYIGHIYKEYNNRLRRNMAMDFDDLLFNMNVLLVSKADLLLKYQEKFKYILVDEYQDTNFSQYNIVKKLSARYRNICVVGDDAQSIYAFRGANIQNILNFQKDYPESKLFKLEQNYRSTQNIVNAANSVIEKNFDKIDKKVWTSNEEGVKINYNELPSDREEAKWVCDIIRNRISNNDAKYGDFAILYRTNQQSRSLEEKLRLMGIPYRIYSGLSFYGRREIKDVLAYFRLVVNNSDDEAFLRIINFPSRGIGDTSLNKLKLFAQENNLSLFSTAETMLQNVGLGAKAYNNVINFCTMIRLFSNRVKQEDAFSLGEEIIRESSIIKYWKDDEDPSSDERINNIEELINAIKAFVETEENEILDEATGEEINIEDKTLDVFIQQASLMSEMDRDDKENENKVSLMTIHSAKGLEFPYVFVTGMEENLFPSNLSLTDNADMEEERRLFYVAMTRAKKELLLASSKSRFRNGQIVCNEKSRFIDEINEKYIKTIVSKEEKSFNDSPFFNNKKTSFNNYSSNKTSFKQNVGNIKKMDNLPKGIVEENILNLKDFTLGLRVYHEKFKEGKILSLEGEGDNMKADVDFENFGIKKLVLRFAKLKLIKEN